VFKEKKTVPGGMQVQGDHKPGILGDFSERGKLREFCATSAKIVTNGVLLVHHSNICVKQLLAG